MPLVRSRSAREPMLHLKGGDYSAFHRNFPRIPVHKHLMEVFGDATRRGGDLNAILGREMEFATSESHIGLQIVDILTNALRRSLSARFQPEGWRPIGRLVIHRNDGAIRLIKFGPGEGRVRATYAPVIEQLNRHGRFMIKRKRNIVDNSAKVQTRKKRGHKTYIQHIMAAPAPPPPSVCARACVSSRGGRCGVRGFGRSHRSPGAGRCARGGAGSGGCPRLGRA